MEEHYRTRTFASVYGQRRATSPRDLTRGALRLIALGEPAREPLLWLKQELSDSFGDCDGAVEVCPCEVSTRSAVNAEHLLEQFTPWAVPARVLAVVDRDLFVPGLNFVFGLAQPDRRRALVGLPRLRETFYSRPEDEGLFQARLLKEAVHELGHTYGLRHCKSRHCVMHFSNTLADTDFKSARFCERCRDVTPFPHRVGEVGRG